MAILFSFHLPQIYLKVLYDIFVNFFQEAAVGMQHDRPSTSDSIRLPLSSAGTTMTVPSGFNKYWILTNFIPGQIPQVCTLTWFFARNKHVSNFKHLIKVSTVYTLPTTTTSRIDESKSSTPSTQACLSAISSTEALIGEHRATSSPSHQNQVSPWNSTFRFFHAVLY